MPFLTLALRRVYLPMTVFRPPFAFASVRNATLATRDVVVLEHQVLQAKQTIARASSAPGRPRCASCSQKIAHPFHRSAQRKRTRGPTDASRPAWFGFLGEGWERLTTPSTWLSAMHRCRAHVPLLRAHRRACKHARVRTPRLHAHAHVWRGCVCSLCHDTVDWAQNAARLRVPCAGLAM